MSSLTHPVGPERPEVYWRRRVTVGVLAVVLVALAAFAVSRIGGNDAAAADRDRDAGVTDETTGTEGTAPATTEEPGPCAAEQLQVVATADAGSYPDGTTPQLGATVRNTGERACTVDLGEPAVTLLVVSGSDRIWSSDDCETETASAPVAVEGAGEQAVTVEWPRQRSAEGCPSDLAEPRPGTYQFTATVAGVTSAPVSFGLE
ncbi:MAG TPA: hypothetical protein VFD41_01215 [Actinomycetales bacterium]|nr:hypothetical protein [Actinomycetales bacterium]